MLVEQEVARHYTHGALERAILDALLASGKDIEKLAPSDLSSVDEFHLGWRAATIALAENLSLESHMHVLDVGSGIGGPARYFAETYGCRVTGIDITEEFIAVASALTRRCGLADVVSFCQASALAVPFANATFDAATLIHVGMNVADKARLFREVRRVLKSGARFGVYNVVDAAGLARISHQSRCIGPGNLRKLFWENDLPGSQRGSDADTVYLGTALFRRV